MKQADQQVDGFTIRRLLACPRERVWRAWTDPDALTHWHHPRGVVTPRETIIVDLRVGGSYSYTMVNVETGTHYPTAGIYLEVSPPERLVFTWGEPGQSPEDAPVVSVTLNEREAGTELVLHLRGLAGRPGDGSVYDGWVEALAALVTLSASE